MPDKQDGMQALSARANFGLRSLWEAVRELAKQNEEFRNIIAAQKQRIVDLEQFAYNVVDGLEQK